MAPVDAVELWPEEEEVLPDEALPEEALPEEDGLPAVESKVPAALAAFAAPLEADFWAAVDVVEGWMSDDGCWVGEMSVVENGGCLTWWRRSCCCC